MCAQSKFLKTTLRILMKFAAQDLQSEVATWAKLYRSIPKFRNKQNAEIESCNEQVPSYVKYLQILHDIMQWVH